MFGDTCHLSWTNVKIAQCFVPGLSSTFKSRAMPLGRSSRKRANALAMPLFAAVSPVEPVCAPLKVKPPRGAPVVLRLQQDVAVVPPVAAELDRVVAPQLGQRRRELPGPLGPVPRQAVDEADQRVGVAVVDVDGRGPARPLVDVDARNAQLIAQVLAVAVVSASLW